ncbi:zinc finger BED domain-containing protein 1-like isoform X3 [Myzus persicae]|uniref:zinc finger BED domain-containing protein 1-like isoform X3 n=1 Tax=Myzus persicae TaxID=13164 RepID=UPI000B939CD6|nr:zinc finger BED domain-containing protein 1-like isoform X3 [Myzus persicae]XP_022160722.1 zinc finger BED domain-containing protein 1-like isoform X3 [Myzus persicae]XP_022160723.1 zinc finger BED domain-containing protein 1-like isoform X3 [Myzus persicae]XP_022160724.1 zinc finger BED domain-containing protein 1-like isoform X3 [Myzus persicae]
MSQIWTSFTKGNEEHNKHLVFCNACGKSFKTSGSTGTLWNHMRTKHNISDGLSHDKPKKRLLEDDDDDNDNDLQNSSTPSIETADIYDNKSINTEVSCSPSTSTTEVSESGNIGLSMQPKITEMFFSPSVSIKRQEQITDSLVKFIAKDMLPLSTVDGVGFVEFMNKISPNYEIPSRFTIKRKIQGLYETEKHKVATEIQNIDSIALTTDCWTSKAMESYICVTAHGITKNWKIVNYIITTELMDERHTSINLKDKLVDIMKEWEIDTKTICIVHDNAVNIKNAVTAMAPNIKSRTCFAHSLQLCVNKGLEENEIKRILITASSIVSHFKHSTVAIKALQVAQKKLKMPEKKLIQSVKTRWNSIYAMVERLIESRQCVSIVLNDRNTTTRTTAISLELGESKWELLEQLVKVLKPFDLVTKVLSSATTPTISIVHPILKSIAQHYLTPNESDLHKIKILKETLSQEFKVRFFSQMHSDSIFLLNIASLLDPRYKNVFDDDSDILITLKDFIMHQLNYEDSSVNDSINQSNSMVSALDILFPQNENGEDVNQQNELEKYLKENCINKNACPLTWWAENGKRYPMISKLAKKYLCIPSTSTPSERAFSTAGNIITSKRNCLAGETAKWLIFLSHNAKL